MRNYQNHAPSEADNFLKTILVAEDDKDIGQFLIEVIKEETAHQVLLVVDGYQALSVVHDIKPSLFVLDYSLPHMNGLELYDRLHEQKELESIPALMISANCPWREAQKRQITCIAKPLELEQFLTAIEGLMT